MTSPALVVLFLAHVCSIIGTTSERAADHDNKQTNMIDNHGAHKIHNKWTNIYKNLEESNRNYINKMYDDIYVERSEASSNLDIQNNNMDMFNDRKTLRLFDDSKTVGKRRMKRDSSTRCEQFEFKEKESFITHPHHQNNKTYYSNSNCVTVIKAPKDNIIILTFIDEFRIEDHPDCAYDYLEIRDGQRGYAKLLDRVCGTAFPRQLTTSGPFAWLKFRSDDTIEYEGFKIEIKFQPTTTSQSTSDLCFFKLHGTVGSIDLKTVDEKCTKSSPNYDILWYIDTSENMKIYLNFTVFKLAKPNECEKNVVEVFGQLPEMDYRLAQYCGSIANPVSTKTGTDGKENNDDVGNIMHIRIFVAEEAQEDTEFKATFTAYRILNPNKDEVCTDDEFDCDDNTCIAEDLHCNDYANCRLKTDEEGCHVLTESTITQPHILVILIIFSLILSTMSFVFLFKCIRKLYQDHKIIKEHIRESCEDRLDMVGSRLTLDAKRLQRDSEPRASLERENQANEMFKRKRESFSKRKATSIDSDYIQETHLDIDEEPWRREVDSVPTEVNDVRIERNGRTRRSEKERQDRRSERASERQNDRRSDMSKKEESIRSKRETEEREKKEIRDASVGAPDTKESGCQTRESLFQADAPPSTDGSGTTGTNSRGFSTFGYSGATISRPSPPATNTSEITIELLRQVPKQDSIKPQKKIDRRPISTETTRSAPDVIIVSKPIR